MTCAKSSVLFVLRMSLLGLVFAAPGTLCSAAGTSTANAAALYRQAFEAMGRGRGVPDPASPTELTPAEWDAISAVGSPEDLTADARAALAKLRPVLDLARQASALPTCDFEPDRAQGYALLLPHLGLMRSLTRAMRADAMARLADGDVDGAMESFGRMAGLARHSADDRVLISSLVGTAIGTLADDSIQVAMDRGVIDQERAARLLEALSPLSGSDPFRCAEAIAEEGDMLAATVQPIIDDPSKLAELRPLLPLEFATELGSEQLEALDAEALTDQLASSMMLLDRSAEAFREPDPERAQAMLEEVEVALSDGAGGVLGQVLVPSLRPVYESKRRAEAMFASRFAQLRDIASGARTPAEFANAALSYLAAARAASTLPADEQRLIEAVRTTLGAVEDPFKRLINEAIERHRGAVVEQVIKGGGAGRCVFVRDRAHTVGLVALPSYSAGLRAAARMTLASALMRLRDAGSQEIPEQRQVAQRRQAVLELESLFRLVSHLSGDSAMAHSLLAHSILEETREALDGVWSTAPLTEDDRALLKAAIDRLDRTDALGYRRALAADRAAVQARAPDRRNDELRRLRKKALEWIEATTLFSCALALQAWAPEAARRAAAPATDPPADEDAAQLVPAFDCGGRDDDVLLDLADLYLQEACPAILARASEIAGAPIFASGIIEQVQRQPRLPGDPLPVLADITAKARDAGGVIAALDALVAQRPPSQERK
jgi:hypothetical protein